MSTDDGCVGAGIISCCGVRKNALLTETGVKAALAKVMEMRQILYLSTTMNSRCMLGESSRLDRQGGAATVIRAKVT